MRLLHGAVLPLAQGYLEDADASSDFLRRVNKLIMQTGPARTARRPDRRQRGGYGTDAAQQHRPEGGARSSPSSQTATSALKNATVKLTQLNTQFGESTVAFAAGRMESVLHSPV